MRPPLYFLLPVLLASSALASEVKNEGEAGLVSTTGNTRAQSFTVKDQGYVRNGRDTYAFFGHYLQAKQNGVENADNWQLGTRYEHELSVLFSLFAGQQVEGDIFAGILQRHNTDVGAKYYLAKQPKVFMWFTEGGYRFTREHTTRGEWNSFQKGRLYSEVQRQWNPHIYTQLWVEYVPNFSVLHNWLMNSEASLSSSLNSVFALKTAYLVRYNNAPPPGTDHRLDTSFTTSLTAKL